jgi:hypothetical protein
MESSVFGMRRIVVSAVSGNISHTQQEKMIDNNMDELSIRREFFQSNFPAIEIDRGYYLPIGQEENIWT